MTGNHSLMTILNKLPKLTGSLSKADCYMISDLTKGKMQSILGMKENVPGIYAISIGKQNNIVYVGRSKNMAVRIGTDHRALQRNQANFTKFLMDENHFKSMKEARKLLFEQGWVRFIRVDDVIERSLLEIYAAVVLKTKYNTFMEH